MDNAVKPIEYTQKKLMSMTRAQLESIANDLNIQAHAIPNKPQLVNAIFAAYGEKEANGGLTDREIAFCENYALSRETFGNGVQSYIEAYDISMSAPGAYQAAQASASRLLMDVIVLSKINEYMSNVVVNDSVVDSQMNFWILQKANPQASIAAIKIYNEVHKRVGDKLGAAKTVINENNYNFSIRDEVGRNISQQFTDYMMEKTKAPQKVIENEAQ